MSSRTTPDFEMKAGELDLPPGFEDIALREMGDAFKHAAAIASERGAGTLVWVRRFDTVEFAVVLEPDEPLQGARRAFYAVMNAAADALATYAPSEKPITFDWPGTIRLDGGILGGGLLAWPDGTLEDSVPGWVVAGITVRALVPLAKGGSLPGSHPLDERLVEGTSLSSEGFETLDGAAIISSFARHLMVQVDRWKAKGFSDVGRDYLARLRPRPLRRGIVHGLDSNGDLLVRQVANLNVIERRSLRTEIATVTPPWMDPQTQEPRL